MVSPTPAAAPTQAAASTGAAAGPPPPAAAVAAADEASPVSMLQAAQELEASVTWGKLVSLSAQVSCPRTHSCGAPAQAALVPGACAGRSFTNDQHLPVASRPL
jgi:hypothetical protein